MDDLQLILGLILMIGGSVGVGFGIRDWRTISKEN